MLRLAIGKEGRIVTSRFIRRDAPLPEHPIQIPELTLASPESIDGVIRAASEKIGDMIFPQLRSRAGKEARRKLGIPENHLAVLAIDGGGVRGLIPLTLLVRLEETYKAPAHEIFDIILGTSVGSIIGALIASGLSAKRIQEFFHSEIHQIFTLARNGEPTEPYAERYEVDLAALPKHLEDVISKIPSPMIRDTAREAFQMTKLSATIWAIAPVARTLSALQADHTLRVIAGSPMYSKRYLRRRLRQLFAERGCETMKDLASKHRIIVVFSAVESHGGDAVYMSATGRDFFTGSCENTRTASCVEASISAPLYFNAFTQAHPELLDGGTLSSNMPILGALIHLERRSQFKVRIAEPRLKIIGKPARSRRPPKPAPDCTCETPAQAATAVNETIFQFFDLHATTILSFGCGTGILKPLNKAFLDCSHDQIHYKSNRWPYGEISKAIEIISGVKGLAADFSSAGFWGKMALGGPVLGPLLAIGQPGEVKDIAENCLRLLKNMKETLGEDARFGIGAAINAFFFLKEGLGRDAWTIQEDVFRSDFYRGNFRRFQLSLNRRMQREGLWKFLSSSSPKAVAARTPAYQIPFEVRYNKELLRKDKYDLVSIWDELTQADMQDFIPSLEPLGTLSLRWLQCIGNRFADAVEEYSKFQGAQPFTIDLADENGQDIFVSPSAQNFVSPSRWEELHEVLH